MQSPAEQFSVADLTQYPESARIHRSQTLMTKHEKESSAQMMAHQKELYTTEEELV